MQIVFYCEVDFMLKFLKRLREKQGKIDSVVLLLLFLDFIARTVDFSDCVCDIDDFEKTFKEEHVDNCINVGYNDLSKIDENRIFERSIESVDRRIFLNQ